MPSNRFLVTTVPEAYSRFQNERSERDKNASSAELNRASAKRQEVEGRLAEMKIQAERVGISEKMFDLSVRQALMGEPDLLNSIDDMTRTLGQSSPGGGGSSMSAPEPETFQREGLTQPVAGQAAGATATPFQPSGSITDAARQGSGLDSFRPTGLMGQLRDRAGVGGAQGKALEFLMLENFSKDPGKFVRIPGQIGKDVAGTFSRESAGNLSRSRQAEVETLTPLRAGLLRERTGSASRANRPSAPSSLTPEQQTIQKQRLEASMMHAEAELLKGKANLMEAERRFKAVITPAAPDERTATSLAQERKEREREYRQKVAAGNRLRAELKAYRFKTLTSEEQDKVFRLTENIRLFGEEAQMALDGLPPPTGATQPTAPVSPAAAPAPGDRGRAIQFIIDNARRRP